MNRTGPLITLLAGLGTAGVLLALSINAAHNDAGRGTDNSAALTSATPAPPTPSASPPTKPVPGRPAPTTDRTRVTYAGRVDGGAATVALAIRDGKAIAYLCDGRRIESWLHGSAAAGQLSLTGSNGGSLQASYGGGRATGSIAIAGKRWTFTAPVARPPGGLYRTATTLANARIVAGWIVLPDGSQVGVLSTDNQPAPAPRLNISSGTAILNGSPVGALPIDGTTGSGF